MTDEKPKGTLRVPKARNAPFKLTEAEKLAIFTAIRDRDVEFRQDSGGEMVKWSPLIKRFCEGPGGIDRRTFFRYVRMVQQGDVDFDAMNAAATAGTAAVSQAVGTATPAFSVAPGQGSTTLDLLAFISDLKGQIEFLRSFSMGLDRAGNVKIQNPRVYTDAMNLMIRLLDAATTTYDKANSYNRMREVYQTVFDALEETSPETVPIFLARLRELGKERGLVLMR